MIRYKLVLVEDEELVALDVGRRLARLGYQLLAHVRTGLAAVAAACQLAPDLVLMDIGLPGDIDGIEAAQRIRERCGRPVVYLTASAEEAVLERVKDTEPEGYLLKPPSDRELRVAIELAIHRHRRETERERQRTCALAEAGRKGGGGAGRWRFQSMRSLLVTPSGVEVPLSAREVVLVGRLTAAPGETVARGELLSALAQPDDPSAHLRLEAAVSRLRRKIRRLDPAEESPVRARHGQGYAFLAEVFR